MRWWIVHRVLDSCGMGPLFRYNNAWRCRYYRLLGAKIGANVKISSSAQLSECDLISIGDGVVIDSAVVSPFAAQAGTMVLKPIVMGQLILRYLLGSWFCEQASDHQNRPSLSCGDR